MIQEFSIENTYSIKTRQTISFEAVQDNIEDSVHYITIGSTRLLKLAAIYGSNASGKSNMLKAVNFYINFIVNAFTKLKPQEQTGFQPFAFSKEMRDKPGGFQLVFFSDDIKYEFEICLDRKCIHTERLSYSPKGQKKLIYQRTCQNCSDECEKLEYDWKWGDTLSGSKKKIADMTRYNVTFLNTAAQLDHPDLGSIYNDISNAFMPLITPGTLGLIDYTIERLEKVAESKKEILNLLSKADFSHINDITVHTKEAPSSLINSFSDEVRKEILGDEGKFVTKEILLSHQYDDNVLMHLSHESAGTRRMLELSGPLLEIIQNKHFITVDEIESSLHQELLEFLLKTFLENSKKSQMLFTTHNLDLLDSEFLIDDEIWFSEKGDDGGSIYTGFVEYTGIRKGTSRKKLYNAGKFGAKPIISSLITD